MIALEDLNGYSQEQIKNHLVSFYSDRLKDEENIEQQLEKLEILVAYESVGAYGCDSSSWFLFKDYSKNLYIVTGSHCSCYGFEGQFDLEKTDISYLTSDRFYLPCGGYDDNFSKNKQEVEKYLNKLRGKV